MRPTFPLLSALALTPLTVLLAAEPPATFCNPLPLPDYPIGHHARDAEKGKRDTREAWILGYQEQFREHADPTAIDRKASCRERVCLYV